jgi:hypothetical protein
MSDNTDAEREIVTVEPGRWVAVAVDGNGPTATAPDGRMVTEIFHSNPYPVSFAVGESTPDSGRVVWPSPVPGDDGYDGYRVRVIPFEDSTYQRFVQSPAPADVLGGHPLEAITEMLEDVGIPREDAERSAESGIREGLELGWYEIVGSDADGRAVYRLTDAGAAHAEELMGLPPGTVPRGR